MTRDYGSRGGGGWGEGGPVVLVSPLGAPRVRGGGVVVTPTSQGLLLSIGDLKKVLFSFYFKLILFVNLFNALSYFTYLHIFFGQDI